MMIRLVPLIAVLALVGCKKEMGPQSLVGDFEAPQPYVLAGDTLTAWQRIRQPDGTWRFQSWSITPGGTVEYLEEQESGGTPADPESTQVLKETRNGFALPAAEFAAIRSQAALLRPGSMGPHDPVRGYGGEVPAEGCTLDKAQPRIAGLNFLNGANWGAFILQAGCDSENARKATATMTQLIDRLQRAANQPK